MDYGLKGKVAIITGAAAHPDGFPYGGMGEETARLLVQEGAKVVLADINAQLGEKLAQELRSQGAEAIFVRTDITSADAIKNLVDKALEAYGTVDILVNAAGVHGAAGKGSMFPNILMEDWNLIFDTHLKGTMMMTQEVVRRVMIPKRSGKIVNVSSLVAHGRHGPAAYAVAKSAISSFTVGCASALGQYGINVNCVSPGLVLTPIWASVGDTSAPDINKLAEDAKKGRMLEMDRPGTGKDIANVIVFLVSEPGSYITAEDINVSAGQVVY